MSNRPFRFIHASDFHLERPLMGVADVPDHLREIFLESPYTAARRVFEAALAEDVRFVVLPGGIAVPLETGPRGPLFLAEQCTRLAERGIDVYWAGSMIDPPEAWPSAVRLPRNVHFFPRGRVEEVLIGDDAGPYARVAGISCDDHRPWRPTDFQPDAGGLFTVAVVHGEADLAMLQSRMIHYWALGGRHDRVTPQTGGSGKMGDCPHFRGCTEFCGTGFQPVEKHGQDGRATLLDTKFRTVPHLRLGENGTVPFDARVIHYCGTTQGRRPEEPGTHGCTLVQVDEQRQIRTSLIPTDAVRWLNERVQIDDATTYADLEAKLRERLAVLVESMPMSTLLISWTIAGRGSLAASLRRGSAGGELLERLRGDFGYRSPAAWSVSLDVELAETLPPEWYEQETIRGDFLRAIRQLQMNADEPLGLENYLAESHRAGGMAAAVAFPDETSRDRVLRETAALGVDLLTGEEPQSPLKKGTGSESVDVYSK